MEADGHTLAVPLDDGIAAWSASAARTRRPSTTSAVTADDTSAAAPRTRPSRTRRSAAGRGGDRPGQLRGGRRVPDQDRPRGSAHDARRAGVDRRRRLGVARAAPKASWGRWTTRRRASSSCSPATASTAAPTTSRATTPTSAGVTSKRRELGSTGDELIAAVSDTGDVVALRGAGFEDEPGYWFGGLLRHRDLQSTRRGSGRGDSTGSTPTVASTQPASTFRADTSRRPSSRRARPVSSTASPGRVVLLSGSTSKPRLWSPPRWSRQCPPPPPRRSRVLASASSAWQAVDEGKTAKSWFSTWAPDRAKPVVHDLGWPTSLTARRPVRSHPGPLGQRERPQRHRLRPAPARRPPLQRRRCSSPSE